MLHTYKYTLIKMDFAVYGAQYKIMFLPTDYIETNLSEVFFFWFPLAKSSIVYLFFEPRNGGFHSASPEPFILKNTPENI